MVFARGRLLLTPAVLVPLILVLVITVPPAESASLETPFPVSGLAGRAPGGHVRILHLGDSHVAADSFVSAVRSHFVQRFGAGEGGLYLPDLPPRTAGGGGRLNLEGAWKMVHAKSATDPETGLAGGWAESTTRGSRARLAGPFAEGKILLLRQPGGGTAAVRIDGRLVAERRLGGPPGVEIVGVPPGSGEVRELEIVAGGDGPVRLLGAVTGSGRPGAVYFPVGVNGALASSLLRIPERLFGEQLRAVEPDVVILAFGTNEARTFQPDAHLLSEQMAALVARVRRAAPAAFVVVTGPPDQARRTKTGGVVAVPYRELVSRAFRIAARREGALFVDLAEAMGGDGAIRVWNAERPPLVQEDLVHFTPAGYLRLARLFAGALDGRETMIRMPVAASVPTGGVRFERDSSGRIKMTNLAPGPEAAPILGKARKSN